MISSTVAQATRTLQCEFRLGPVAGTYHCYISNFFFLENENIVFSGNHIPNQNDGNVNGIFMSNFFSQPSIINAAFVRFPNLRVYSVVDTVMPNTMNIQANAFQGAVNLHEIIISSSGVASINVAAFTGATNLRLINLSNNHLDTVPLGLLNTLVNLETINLSNNRLTSIPANFFQPAVALTNINLNNNQLIEISQNLLSSNPRLIQFHAISNQIERISRQFIDNLSALTTLSLAGNVCIGQNFVGIGTTTPISQVHEALQVCYDNYGTVITYQRDFRMHLRGRITLKRDDGSLVGVL